MPANYSHRHITALMILAAVAVYLSVASTYVENGEVNADEGFYAYASYAAMHGQIPYRDFAFTQMPLLPYLQGPIMSVVGFGIRQQRWINLGFSVLAVTIGMALWYRSRLHPLACGALLLVWCLCRPVVYYDTVGKTYAVSMLLLLAAGGCLSLTISPRLKLCLLSLFGVLVVGCRLTTAPSILILWLGLVVMHRKELSWVSLIGVPLLFTLILLGPFFYFSPSSFIFWNWSYHLQSVYEAHRWWILSKSFKMAPGVALLGLVGIGLLVAKRGTAGVAGGCLFLAGIIGWLFNVGSPGIYAEYGVPYLTLILVGSGLLLSQTSWSAIKLAAVCVGALALTPAGSTDEQIIGNKYLDLLDHTAAYIQSCTKPGDVVLTSMPEVALAANRPIFPGLEMGKFGLTAEMDDGAAEAKRIITFEQLISAVDHQSAPVIVLSNFHRWNFSWSVPSLKIFTTDFYQRFSKTLFQHYDCVGKNRYFLIFRVHDPNIKPIPLDIKDM
ncbi:MAG TPA: hypothetical protein VFB27_02770 [Opitutaceae bacterium]|nr:hypothetical protein [Opitutaceae bacterium]